MAENVMNIKEINSSSDNVENHKVIELRHFDNDTSGYDDDDNYSQHSDIAIEIFNNRKNSYQIESDSDNLYKNTGMIDKIESQNIDANLLTELLTCCDINTQSTYNLSTLHNNLVFFVRLSLSSSSVCPATMIQKYNSIMALIIEEINVTLQTLSAGAKINNIPEIKDIYNVTQTQLISLPMKDNESYSYLLHKIITVLKINKNIIIITSLWKKQNTINEIIKHNLDIYTKVMESVVKPLKQDLTNFHISSTYQPRLLMQPEFKSRSKSSFTPRHISRDKDDINTETSTIKNTDTSTIKSPGRRPGSVNSRDIDDMSERYMGDFTSKTRISYDQLSSIINSSYGNSANIEYSTALDIMSIYLRGQKILYREAMTYSENGLNMLTIPAIIINLVAGVIAALWISNVATIIVVCLCALNSMLVALINQLKLGEKTEAYRTSAYHFETLETKCQFISGKMMYIDEEIDLPSIIAEIEEKVTETKKANQFVLPDHVTISYPMIYNTNVFSLVKEIYIKETVLRNNLKNIINSLNLKVKNPRRDIETLKEMERLEKLQDEKLNEVIQFKREYLHIDYSFNKEIERNLRIKQSKWCNGFGLFNILTCGGCNAIVLWIFKSHFDKKNISKAPPVLQADHLEQV